MYHAMQCHIQQLEKEIQIESILLLGLQLEATYCDDFNPYFLSIPVKALPQHPCLSIWRAVEMIAFASSKCASSSLLKSLSTS